MNLILDIGNTLAKVAIVENQNIVYSQSHDGIVLNDIKDIARNYDVHKCIISIVGKTNSEIINFLNANYSTIILNAETKLPIKNLYSTPETLGYDRIAVAVGANYLYPNRNTLVIDAGTAITYELTTAQGEYKGGAISPGISLRFKALNDHTAKLPYLEKTDKYPTIGQTTNDCIRAGVLNGVVNEIDGYIDQIKTISPDICILLTGGDSNFFASKLKNSIFVNQNLMAIGLNRILDFNIALNH